MVDQLVDPYHNNLVNKGIKEIPSAFIFSVQNLRKLTCNILRRATDPMSPLALQLPPTKSESSSSSWQKILVLSVTGIKRTFPLFQKNCQLFPLLEHYFHFMKCIQSFSPRTELRLVYMRPVDFLDFFLVPSGIVPYVFTIYQYSAFPGIVEAT